MRGRLCVRDGFWVLLAALHLVDETGVLPWFLLAAAVHEAGHMLVLHLGGGRLNRLTLGICGAVISCRLPEGRCARGAVCLAGPAASFALAAAAMHMGQTVLAGASILLGFFNLLPMPPLDGGMALHHLAEGNARKLRSVIAALCTGLLACTGTVLACMGGGIWLLAICVAIVPQMVKNLAKQSPVV